LSDEKIISPNIDFFSFLEPVLEKIIVILPTGEKPMDFSFGGFVTWIIFILLIILALHADSSSRFEDSYGNGTSASV